MWELDELLTIVKYESEPRNRAIITLLWDMDVRNHEIRELKIRDIVLKEQYGEGEVMRLGRTVSSSSNSFR